MIPRWQVYIFGGIMGTAVLWLVVLATKFFLGVPK